MLFLSCLVSVVELLPCGYGESGMHRNGFGFTGHRTGTPNVVPVSPAFNRDEFASPLLSIASQPATQVWRPLLAWLGSESGPKLPLLVCSPILCCLSLPERRSHNNPGKSNCGFRVRLV